MTNRMRYPDKWLTRRWIINTILDAIGAVLIMALILSISVLLYTSGYQSGKSDALKPVYKPVTNAPNMILKDISIKYYDV